MKLNIELELNNDSMINSYYEEIKNILNKEIYIDHIIKEANILYDNVKPGDHIISEHDIKDINGNIIGNWKITT